MKSICLLAIFLGMTASSYAILGIGGQWAPNFSAEIKGSQDTILGTASTPNFSFNQGSKTGLTGFGAKVWLDFLPFVDIEASSNIQFAKYNGALTLANTPGAALDTTINLEVETGLPGFDKATPIFGKITSDLSILYPFLKLPPLISIVKVYAGAGISHVLSTAVLDAEFATKAVTEAQLDPTTATADEVATAITTALKDEGLQSGIGFHVMLGAKLKPPIVPFAVFVNGKYHMGGSLPSAISSGFTAEMGAALAF